MEYIYNYHVYFMYKIMSSRSAPAPKSLTDGTSTLRSHIVDTPLSKQIHSQEAAVKALRQNDLKPDDATFELEAESEMTNDVIVDTE